MYKPVIMITRAAKEICIYYSRGYYPFFIWNVGIDITGSNNMQLVSSRAAFLRAVIVDYEDIQD